EPIPVAAPVVEVPAPEPRAVPVRRDDATVGAAQART
ncbi:MAG: hypothetical protein QOI00_1018, partial [Chloroflexota bacterium]|nr:hypothetical protein [Chloroflexota bacterium]